MQEAAYLFREFLYFFQVQMLRAQKHGRAMCNLWSGFPIISTAAVLPLNQTSFCSVYDSLDCAMLCAPIRLGAKICTFSELCENRAAAKMS